MIAIYLEQIPPLILIIKQSLQEKDWHTLYAAVHKIIPSFSIMGMGVDFENIAKKVQEYAKTQEETDNMPHLVAQLENVCQQACEELKEKYNTIKNAKN
jgi:HPt (histidine-containing phosphotransfer) domain-containing protein